MCSYSLINVQIKVKMSRGAERKSFMKINKFKLCFYSFVTIQMTCFCFHVWFCSFIYIEKVMSSIPIGTSASSLHSEANISPTIQNKCESQKTSLLRIQLNSNVDAQSIVRAMLKSLGLMIFGT